ncbi:Uncharacterised protein [Vibrio cholerae]|nr:Uncharacterised protein [Vibrio cholerae]CSI58250.1 Uncharacterised protein [Vibrio cholerae]
MRRKKGAQRAHLSTSQKPQHSVQMIFPDQRHHFPRPNPLLTQRFSVVRYLAI